MTFMRPGDNMCSGGNDVSSVTLSLYPHRENQKSVPDHARNRTYHLSNASPMLCYTIQSV